MFCWSNQRLSEHVALLDVLDGEVDRLLGLDDGVHRQQQAFLRHLGHQRRETRALLTDPVGDGYPTVVEEQLCRVGGVLADLAERLTAPETFGRRLDRDESDRLRIRRVLELDGDDDEVCGEPVGDERLGAVDHVLVAVAPTRG